MPDPAPSAWTAPEAGTALGSDRERFIGAIEHYRRHRLSHALALLEREGSPLGNVRGVVRFFEQHAPEVSSCGCRLGSTLVAMCPRDVEITRFLRETLEILREAVERSLHDAWTLGELAEEKSPRSLSWALTSAMVGLGATGYGGTLSILD